MPELPEVEILVRHLAPAILGKVIRSVKVRRERVVRPTSVRALEENLKRARFEKLTRRGKFLLFTLAHPNKFGPLQLTGHLGMTGRMYLSSKSDPLPKHAAVVLDLGEELFVFEDTRYFGRFTLDKRAVEHLGPEPLSAEFTVKMLSDGLQRCRQAIKVKLLDQSLIAGVGNIYASEALFRAGISPRMPAFKLSMKQVARLWKSIRQVLGEAIERGSRQPLDFVGSKKQDSLFYFGSSSDPVIDRERFQVYDRDGEACFVCSGRIRRCIQAARSTFYCPQCQSARRALNSRLVAKNSRGK